MKLKNVSASQVSTFARCKRRWHWEKIMGFRSPSSRAMRRGTAIHYALELYLETGEVIGAVEVDIAKGSVTKNTSPKTLKEPPKEAEGLTEWWPTKRYVESVKGFLPPPGSAKGPNKVYLEKEFSIPTLDGNGPPWIGFIDLLEETEHGIKVTDYKTSSDIRRYAKSKTELETDIQSNAYAKFVFDISEELNEVEARWLYLETRNKVKVNTAEVCVTLKREEIEENWNKAMKLVAEMVQLAEIEDTLSIEPNPEACPDHGGCPHRDRCGLSALKGMFSELGTGVKKGSSMGFLKGLKEKINEVETEEMVKGVLSEDSASRETSDEEFKELTDKKKKTKKTKKTSTKSSTDDTKANKEIKEVTKSFTLYVDCIPTKGGNYQLLHELVAPLMEKHGGLEAFWDLDFSGQKKALSIIGKDISKTASDKGFDVVAISSEMFARDIISIMSIVAHKVTIGVKY